MTTGMPVEFPVIVEGRTMTARVLEEIPHEIHRIYRIRFSNGFEDEFSSATKYTSVFEGTRPGWHEYAKAIKADMAILPLLNTTRFYHVFTETIITNVWVVEVNKINGAASFDIYYGEYYRFTLSRKEDTEPWHIQTRSKDPIDVSIAQKVAYLLNSQL